MEGALTATRSANNYVTMGQALYRKYRSRSLDEIVGQEHITDTLARAIKLGRVSHAYLFTGPRGVGKTSIARILAHQLNDMPYSDEDSHIDIIEIDAASNRGIDEIRGLREKVFIAPTSGKYKVYIIDEVHMLTTPAFNALLKTLEEPPAHVIFILATTEAHKLPDTIISRTQRYSFRPVEQAKVIKHLRFIADKENIGIDDAALQLIAAHGEGSFRDSISLLDQAHDLSDQVDETIVRELLGIPPTTAVQTLLQAMTANDLSQLLTTLGSLQSQGYQAGAIAKQLAAQLRNQLIDEPTTTTVQWTTYLLERLIDVPASHQPHHLLEIILVEAASRRNPSSGGATKGNQPPAAAPDPAPTKSAVTQPPVSTPPLPVQDITPKKPAATTPPEPKAVETVKTATKVPTGNGALDEANWQQVLTSLKKQYNTLYSVMRMANTAFDDDKLTLTFGFAFHQKRANDAKNKAIVSSVIEAVTGATIEIVCLYDKNVPLNKPAVTSDGPSAAKMSPPLASISNIFGGGELLES